MPVSRLLPGLLICASLLPAVRTWAEETTEVAAVTVTAVRDPGLMPYAKVDALRSALQQDTDPHDKVRVMFRVMDAKTQLPAKDVRINLWTNDAVYPVPLQDSFIALDELPHTNDPDAKFASNKRAGALELDLLLFAVLPDAQKFSAADAQAAIDQANAIRKAVIPWYLRAFIPRFTRLEACAASTPVYTVDGQPWAAPVAAEAGCVSINEVELKAHPQAMFAAAGPISSYRLRGPGKDD
ncbi:hypothetical protein JCM19000A_29740 [Silvimonas sp. JCM 19000]